MPRPKNEKDPLKAVPLKLEASKQQVIKYIAWQDRRTITAVYKLALEAYVKQWEADNGPVTPDLLAKMEAAS